MTVITVSRQMGSHGEEIATEVAQTLGLRLIDAATINQAALRAGVPQVALAELEHESGRGLARQVLSALRVMPTPSSVQAWSQAKAGEAAPAGADLSGLAIPFAGIFSAAAPPLSGSLDSYIRMVGMVIRGLARQGNLLILGRGAQVLLRNQPSVFHVQVVAPQAHRVEVVMASQGLKRADAQKRVRDSDRARADYLRRYHNADWLDPTLYHLVVNTARLTPATAVELIIAAHRSTLPAPEGAGPSALPSAE